MTRHATDADYRGEDRIRAAIEAAWKCDCRSYGGLSPVDCFCVYPSESTGRRNGQVVCHAEIKRRTHTAEKHATVWVSQRKYMSLVDHIRTAPGIFVIEFRPAVEGHTDVRWIGIWEMDIRPALMRGWNTPLDGDVLSQEPMFDVPVASMHRLGPQTPWD